MSKNVAEYFACDVFNDEVMKARLPKAVYKALTKTRKLGVPLDPTYADVVANALKDGQLNTVQHTIPIGSSQ